MQQNSIDLFFLQKQVKINKQEFAELVNKQVSETASKLAKGANFTDYLPNCSPMLVIIKDTLTSHHHFQSKVHGDFINAPNKIF
jgi:hypothetical protein